jgi:inositol-pentakisphosphate 2-kinase
VSDGSFPLSVQHIPMMVPQDVKMPDVSSTSPEDWIYISEGGATIVFSYVGQPREDFTGTVVRLRKAPRTISADKPPAPALNDDGGDEPDDPSVAFQARVSSRLVPAEHLPRMEVCLVTRTWLESLVGVSENLRPLKRREADGIDVFKRKAVLATDLVGGGGWAIEIKVW